MSVSYKQNEILKKKASPMASLFLYSCLVTCRRNNARCNAASARSTSISGVGLDNRPYARSLARRARSTSMDDGSWQSGVTILTLLCSISQKPPNTASSRDVPSG